MNLESIGDESSFKSAISAVEALSLEDQAMLIDIIQKRLHQQHNSELRQEFEEVGHEYAVGNFGFASIDDFLAEFEL
ncbi:MAG: hypothetical protein AAF298_03475 [Cyanobacteria bacterium P01_A01_bin.40]